MKTNLPTPAAETKWTEQPLEWPRAAGHVEDLLAAVALRKKRRRRRAVALAAGAATAVAALWFGLPAPVPPAGAPAGAAPARSAVIMPERLTLPDGSVAALQHGTALAVHFEAGSAGPRRVELTKGSAFFHVAKDAARPFVVEVGTMRFRAVGTAFTVKTDETAVEMLVTEGRVAFERAAPEPGAAARHAEPQIFGAGQRVVVGHAPSASPAVATVPAAALPQTATWRVPRLEFNETPLREVVRLLSEHSGRRVSLADPDLGRVEISGALRADNLEPLLEILAGTYGIAAEHRSDGVVVLRARR